MPIFCYYSKSAKPTTGGLKTHETHDVCPFDGHGGASRHGAEQRFPADHDGLYGDDAADEGLVPYPDAGPQQAVPDHHCLGQHARVRGRSRNGAGWCLRPAVSRVRDVADDRVHAGFAGAVGGCRRGAHRRTRS